MSDEFQPDTRIPLAVERTDMAIFRTSLALDRTTLAWIRTTLTMATFGLGTIGFFRTLRQQAKTPETIRLHQMRSTWRCTGRPGNRLLFFSGNHTHVDNTEAQTRRNPTAPAVAAEHHDIRSALTDGSL